MPLLQIIMNENVLDKMLAFYLRMKKMALMHLTEVQPSV